MKDYLSLWAAGLPERDSTRLPTPVSVVAGQLIVYNTIYALLYSTMALCGGILIFQRRNLK